MKNHHYLLALVLLGMQNLYAMDDHSQKKESNADHVVLKNEKLYLEFIYGMTKTDRDYKKAFEDLRNAENNTNYIVTDKGSLRVLAGYEFLDTDNKVQPDICQLMKTMPKK